MIDPVPALPARLTFAYQVGELPRLREMAWRSVSGRVSWSGFWGVLGAMIFVLGFAVLGVQRSGLITTAAVPPVLATAYVAFYAGAGLVLLMLRLITHNYARAADEKSGTSDITWEMEFDDAGYGIKSALSAMRVNWHAVKSIEAWPGCISLWLGQWHFQMIPSRVFPDDAARVAFIAAVRARIDRATKA